MDSHIEAVNCNNTSCPLHLSCSRTGTQIIRNPHASKESIDFLFVGDSANISDMRLHIPFKDYAGNFLRKVVSKTMPEASIGYSLAVRGWPVNLGTLAPEVRHQNLEFCSDYQLKNATPYAFSSMPNKQEIVRNCSPFLDNDIQKYKPKAIIALGNNVKEVLFPREMRSLSQLLEDDSLRYRDIPVRFLANPSMVLYNPSSRHTWERRLVNILRGRKDEKDTKVGKHYLITDLQEAIDYIDALKMTPNYVAIDTETLNLNKRYGNKMACIQFSESNDTSAIIPFLHWETPFSPDELEILRKHLYSLFAEPSEVKAWLGHNMKFECTVLKANVGTQVLSAPIYDTQIGAFLLDENRSERAADFKYGIYTLKQLAYDYLNFDGYNSGILAKRAEGNLWDLPLKELADYGGMDAYITRRLWDAEVDSAKIHDYKHQLINLMENLYTPMINLFTDVEWNGSPADIKQIRKLIARDSVLLKEMSNIQEKVKEDPRVIRANDILLGADANNKLKVQPLGRKPWIFDFGKGGHPQTLFFTVMGLEAGKVGKSGAPSVGKKWQERYADNDMVKNFMNWLTARLLYSTFAKKLYEFVDPGGTHIDCSTDCKIRPSFLFTRAVTGRIACKDPNMQNIPRGDSPVKSAIKNVFVAMPDHFLVQIDYRANEVRWVGILSQDETLAGAIKSSELALDKYRKNPTEELLREVDIYGDTHKQVASMIFNKPIEEISKDERQIAKKITFSLLYDSSLYAISQSLNVEVSTVQKWFDLYYSKFPKVKTWKEEIKNMAQSHAYIEAPHGRRRRFPLFEIFTRGINEVPDEYRKKAESALRQSSNAPIQGIASDAGMLGASLFGKYIREHKKPWYIQNAVHDSAIMQCPKDQLEELLEVSEYWFTTGVMNHMTEKFGVNFILPLGIDYEIGLKWGELKKWDFNLNNLKTLKEGLECM